MLTGEDVCSKLKCKSRLAHSDLIATPWKLSSPTRALGRSHLECGHFTAVVTAALFAYLKVKSKHQQSTSSSVRRGINNRRGKWKSEEAATTKSTMAENADTQIKLI